MMGAAGEDGEGGVLAEKRRRRRGLQVGEEAMERSWLIVPDFSRLDESAALAREYGAAFEYDDFYAPEVYEDEREVERRIAGYLALERDRSRDTLHGVFFDIKPNSRDSVIRQRSRALMRQSLAIAGRLGVRGVVFHLSLIHI